MWQSGPKSHDVVNRVPYCCIWYDKKLPIETFFQKLTHLETEIFGLPKKVIYPGEVHEAALGSVTRNAGMPVEPPNHQMPERLLLRRGLRHRIQDGVLARNDTPFLLGYFSTVSIHSTCNKACKYCHILRVYIFTSTPIDGILSASSFMVTQTGLEFLWHRVWQP